MDLLVAIGIGYVILAAIFLKLYAMMTCGMAGELQDLTGQTAIVTGGNAGIGYETALGLAKKKARVILACRSKEKAKEAVMKIQKESGNKNVTFKIIDLTSFKSVRKFAEEFLRTEKRLDILINNAGLTGPIRRQTTEDDLELVMHSNYFGHFLLTNLLLDLLKAAPNARIINLSSVMHWFGKINFNDLNFEKMWYNVSTAYGTSKLAMHLFTKELVDKLEETGGSVYTVNPGCVQTKLNSYHIAPIRIPLAVIEYLYFKSPEEGAQTSLYCAAVKQSPGNNGAYFSDCGLATESKTAQDRGISKKFWEASEQLTGLST